MRLFLVGDPYGRSTADGQAVRSGCALFGLKAKENAATGRDLTAKEITKRKKHANACLFLFGDPYGNRTHAFAVRGRRLSRLTKGPCGTFAIISHPAENCNPFLQIFLFFSRFRFLPGSGRFKKQPFHQRECGGVTARKENPPRRPRGGAWVGYSRDRAAGGQPCCRVRDGFPNEVREVI